MQLFKQKGRTEYGALINGRANCMGYTHAMSLLCELADIPWYEVLGDVIGEGEGEWHTWSVVKLQDGKWYEMDVTWDDEEKISYTYFLLTTKEISLDHFRDNVYGPYPVAKGTKYAYKDRNEITVEFYHKNCLYKVLKGGKKVELVRCDSTVKNITIPGTINKRINDVKLSYKVTSIAKYAFKDNAKVQKITLGENVSSVGKGAFNGCKNLTFIDASKSRVKKIPDTCIKGCKKFKKIKTG